MVAVAPPAGDYSNPWPAAAMGYSVQMEVPANGDSINARINQRRLAIILNHAALLLLLTIKMPPNPQDGDVVVFGTAQPVTAFTVDGNGNPVKGLLAGLAINSFVRYIFSTDAGAWFRVG